MDRRAGSFIPSSSLPPFPPSLPSLPSLFSFPPFLPSFPSFLSFLSLCGLCNKERCKGAGARAAQGGLKAPSKLVVAGHARASYAYLDTEKASRICHVAGSGAMGRHRPNLP